MKRLFPLILLLIITLSACRIAPAASLAEPTASPQAATTTPVPPSETATSIPPTTTPAPTDTPTTPPTATNTPTPESQIRLEQVYRFQGKLLPQTTGSQKSEGNFVADGGPVYMVAFSPDGTLFAMGGRGNPADDFDEQAGRLFDTVFLFDLVTGNQLWQLNPAKQGSKTIYDLVFHPLEPYLFGVYQDRSVVNWDLENGERENIYQDHRGAAVAVEVSSDGTLLAAAIADTVRLWSSTRGWAYDRPKPTLTLTIRDVESRTSFNDVAFSPDGMLLAASTEADVVFWNPSNGQELMTLNPGGVELAFSPDGKTLAAAGSSSLTLWNLETQEPLTIFSEKAVSLAYAPDGAILAWTNGIEIVLWDIVTNLELLRVPAHEGPINVIRFSNDGQFLATGSEDLTAIVWRVIQ
jgi:WD40 repeat protein